MKQNKNQHNKTKKRNKQKAKIVEVNKTIKPIVFIWFFSLLKYDH